MDKLPPLNRPRLITELALTVGFTATALSLTNAAMSDSEQIAAKQQDVLIPYEVTLHPERAASAVPVDDDPTNDPGFYQLPPNVQDAKKNVAALQASLKDESGWAIGLICGSLATCTSLGLHLRSKKFPPPRKNKTA